MAGRFMKKAPTTSTVEPPIMGPIGSRNSITGSKRNLKALPVNRLDDWPDIVTSTKNCSDLGATGVRHATASELRKIASVILV
eukprot:16982_5